VYYRCRCNDIYSELLEMRRLALQVAALEFQRIIYLEHGSIKSINCPNCQSCNCIHLMLITTNCYLLHSVQHTKLSIAHDKLYWLHAGKVTGGERFTMLWWIFQYLNRGGGGNRASKSVRGACCFGDFHFPSNGETHQGYPETAFDLEARRESSCIHQMLQT
jgi:hypothetical protein